MAHLAVAHFLAEDAQGLAENGVVVKGQFRNLVDGVPKYPFRKTGGVGVEVLAFQQGKVGHRDDARLRIFPVALQPSQILDVPDTIGVAKGTALVQVNALQARQFPQNPLGSLVQTLLVQHQIAGQSQADALAHVLLFDQQNIESVAVETKYDAVNGNVWIYHRLTKIME